jgi:hypothetical protein
MLKCPFAARLFCTDECDLSSTAIFAQEKGISVEMAEGGSAGA